MAPKRPLEASEAAPHAKKQKHGFRVGPENLPDGAWRRKVTKIKQDLIHKAKIKKAYAKIKAREPVVKPHAAAVDEGDSDQEDAQQEEPVMDESDGAHDQDDRKGNGGGGGGGGQGEDHNERGEEIHPTRKLMLKDEEMAQAGAEPDREDHGPSDGQRRRTRRPGYYDKQLQKAEQKKTEAENRRREFERRDEERRQKTAERDRYRRAMAKTRDRDGNKKLGRESALLLEKVKKLVAQK